MAMPVAVMRVGRYIYCRSEGTPEKNRRASAFADKTYSKTGHHQLFASAFAGGIDQLPKPLLYKHILCNL